MMMKKDIALSLRSFAMTWALIGLMIVFCYSSYAQIQTGFAIEGAVKGLKNGSKLCIMIKRNGKIDTIARTIAQSGVFKFKDLKLPVYPDFYLISVTTEFVEDLNLFLDQAGDVKIKGVLMNWPNLQITGSDTHNDFAIAKKIIRRVWDVDFKSKYPNGVVTTDTLLMFSKVGIEYVVKQMPASFYIPAMIANWKDPAFGSPINADIKRPFYIGLSEAQKNSYYGKILAKQVGIKE